MSESNFTIRVWSDDSPISTVLETTCTCGEAVDIFKDVLNKVYGLESSKKKYDLNMNAKDSEIAPVRWDMTDGTIKVYYPNCGRGIDKINHIYRCLKDRLNISPYVSVARYMVLCNIPVPDNSWQGVGWDALPCGDGEENIDISHDARHIWLKLPRWKSFIEGVEKWNA